MGGSAVAVAFLGLLEALAIAKSIANETRQQLDYNRQCLAEGLANLGGGFLQCLPGSGSLTRSAINFQSGAATRFSGVITAAAVAVAVIFFAPLARFIPKSALAGLLVVTAARLVDWRRLAGALRVSGYDAGLVLVTAFVAVFVSVEFSILSGVALSIVLFVPRAARLKGTELVVDQDRVIRARAPQGVFCESIVIYDLEGELFFGAAPELDRYFEDIKARVAGGARVVVLRVRRARNPDLVCLERLEHFLQDMKRASVPVLLSGVRDDFTRGLRNLKVDRELAPGHVFAGDPEQPGLSTVKAVQRAYALLGEDAGALSCAHCTGIDVVQKKLYYMV